MGEVETHMPISAYEGNHLAGAEWKKVGDGMKWQLQGLNGGAWDPSVTWRRWR